MDWLQIFIGNNGLYEWLIALAVGTALLILLRLAKWGALRCLALRTPRNNWYGITLAIFETFR
jgi:hypothetical protein